MLSRLNIKIPMWAALAVVGAAYIFRALVERGGDFSPDLPSDALAAAALAVGFGLIAWLRFMARREEAQDNPDQQRDDEDQHAGSQR